MVLPPGLGPPELVLAALMVFTAFTVRGMSGFGAGIDTVFSGGGGTLVVVYLHMRGVGRQPFRATVAVVWLVEMVARMIGYGAAGYYTVGTLLLCLLLLPMMWAGTCVGERIGNRISQDTFSKVLSALLALTGVMLILK
jgi:hypothetical protein